MAPLVQLSLLPATCCLHDWRVGDCRVITSAVWFASRAMLAIHLRRSRAGVADFTRGPSRSFRTCSRTCAPAIPKGPGPGRPLERAGLVPDHGSICARHHPPKTVGRRRLWMSGFVGSARATKVLRQPANLAAYQCCRGTLNISWNADSMFTTSRSSIRCPVLSNAVIRCSNTSLLAKSQ